MESLVAVDDRLYERMYVKVVLTQDGVPRTVPQGELPEPGETILAAAAGGEPAFRISLATPVTTDEDVPDEVGFALRRASQRFLPLRPDGAVSTGGLEAEDLPVVEWILGPGIRDGDVVVALDTDGTGAGPALVSAMVAILVEQLEGTGVPVSISVPDGATSMIPSWASSEERAASA